MKQDDVPQDQSAAFEGQKKPLYVIDEDGKYTTELSSGWDVEEVVLDQAIAQFEALCDEARLRVEQKLSAPLEYHMYQRRMDISVLAQSTGFFQWQVKRHLKPAVFARLNAKKLARYQEALGLSLSELQSMPNKS